MDISTWVIQKSKEQFALIAKAATFEDDLENDQSKGTKLKSEKIQGARRETEAGDQTRLRRMGYELVGGGAKGRARSEAVLFRPCKKTRMKSL